MRWIPLAVKTTLFSTALSAAGFFAQAWSNQKEQNAKLAEEFQDLATRSAKIVEAQKVAARYLDELDQGRVRVLQGTLTQVKMEDEAINQEVVNPDYELVNFAVAEGATEIQGEASEIAREGIETVENNQFRFLRKLHDIKASMETSGDQLASLPSIRPTDGWISSKYGKRINPVTGKWQYHKGIDIAARKGTPVVASADGLIVRAKWHGAYGRVVEIDHGQGLVTRYAHNNKIFVKKGDRVKRGEKIATVGMTGRTTGSHLHYEVMLNGKFVNPWRFVTLAKKHKKDLPEDQTPLVFEDQQTLAKADLGMPVDEANIYPDFAAGASIAKTKRLASTMAIYDPLNVWSMSLAALMFFTVFAYKRARKISMRQLTEAPFAIADMAANTSFGVKEESVAEPVRYWRD